MKQKLNSIEEDTVLVLYLIAERAIHDTIMAKYPKCTTTSAGQAVEYLSPLFCERAEMHYQKDEHFRKGIRKGWGSRENMGMWFVHWTQGAIGRGRAQMYKYDNGTNELIKL